MIFPIVRHATKSIVFSVTTAAITGMSTMGPWSSDVAKPHREVSVPRNRRERRSREASKRHKKLIRAKARVARTR